MSFLFGGGGSGNKKGGGKPQNNPTGSGKQHTGDQSNSGKGQKGGDRQNGGHGARNDGQHATQPGKGVKYGIGLLMSKEYAQMQGWDLDIEIDKFLQGQLGRNNDGNRSGKSWMENGMFWVLPTSKFCVSMNTVYEVTLRSMTTPVCTCGFDIANMKHIIEVVEMNMDEMVQRGIADCSCIASSGARCRKTETEVRELWLEGNEIDGISAFDGLKIMFPDLSLISLANNPVVMNGLDALNGPFRAIGVTVSATVLSRKIPREQRSLLLDAPKIPLGMLDSAVSKRHVFNFSQFVPITIGESCGPAGMLLTAFFERVRNVGQCDFGEFFSGLAMLSIATETHGKHSPLAQFSQVSQRLLPQPITRRWFMGVTEIQRFYCEVFGRGLYVCPQSLIGTDMGNGLCAVVVKGIFQSDASGGTIFRFNMSLMLGNNGTAMRITNNSMFISAMPPRPLRTSVPVRTLYYFAYSWNMDADNMARLCPGLRCLSLGCLDGFRVVQRRFADIEAGQGSKVFGVIYEVKDDHLRFLDADSDAFYMRTERVVSDPDGRQISVYTHEMKPSAVKELSGKEYSEDYRFRCRSACEASGVIQLYVASRIEPPYTSTYAPEY